jgi:hypothetical protein
VDYSYFVDNYFVHFAIADAVDLHVCLYEQDVLIYYHFVLLVICAILPE